MRLIKHINKIKNAELDKTVERINESFIEPEALKEWKEGHKKTVGFSELDKLLLNVEKNFFKTNFFKHLKALDKHLEEIYTNTNIKYKEAQKRAS